MLRTKTLLLLAFMLIGAACLTAQTKKVKVEDTSLSHTYTVYHVLDTDPNVKEGDYKQQVHGFLAVEGHYTNNQRTGVWTYYLKDGQSKDIIDYDKGTIVYFKMDSITHKTQSTVDMLQPMGDRDVICLTSGDCVLEYLSKLIRYPDEARENNISGRALVNMEIDVNGKISSYSNANNANAILYDEAVRVLKLIPYEFLPAYKNGKPAVSQFKMPVSFTLQ